MTESIPRTQTAAVVTSKDEDIQIRLDFPVKQPHDLAPGECLIKIEATGVCHSDLHARLDDWPTHPKLPLVGGHEGVGRIVAIGNHTSHSPVKLGDRVGIKWLANSCLHCEHCRKGREINCRQAQTSGFTIDGTFQEYAVSFVNHVTLIPEGISSEAAASILCAGVTVYRALKHSGAQHGDWVVLPGAGGGLGHLAVQYARARGLRVVAVDTGEAKKEMVMKLGAEVWIDFKETEDMVKAIKEATGGEGPHVALITATSTAAYQQAVDYLRPGGRLMAVSLPSKATLDASIYWIVAKCIIIQGSAVGNRQDAKEAIDIAARGEVKVIYDLKGLSDLKEIYQRLEDGKVAGRIVLDMKK